MFKKLKRKFILTNVLTSAIVLVVAFTSIYLVAAASSRERIPRKNQPVPMEQERTENYTQNINPASGGAANQEFRDNVEFNAYLEEQLASERDAALKSLLMSLIITGLAMEFVIALISIYLAEQSVKPVRDAYLAQKSFVANASHEIKTPLAVIQANLEAADIKGNKWLDNVSKKVEDLAILNNELLTLAKNDALSESPKATTVDLDKVVDSVIAAFEPKVEEKGITIERINHLNMSPQIRLNRRSLEQILNIYIDNAIKYGRKKIGINIYKNRISVTSDGALLKKSDLPHLFDRFYQIDKTKDGVGLGLAIADSTAKKNGWKVYASVDEKHKENVFTVEFK
ncbi:HAMP domain-containing histidine kinase [Candidatus Saccharibacteria bacterium]|nr:HAMP domain-containing histidine kinase [Candidatus Saccharibacteria bacterium]